MKEFWNERYGQQAYAYGTEPNIFFKEKLESYKVTGKILMPAEGEGRNAVFAAKQGLEVTAFDMSEEGRNKAMLLAEKNHVTLNYKIGALDKLQLKEASFDAVGLIFAHFPIPLLSEYHQDFVKLLKPGGIVILEGFSKEQLKYSSGGPKNLDMLFSVEEIKRDFSQLVVLELEESVVELSEGPFHQGKGSVIRYVGRKPLN